ncbi:E3 ubiquitin-protein ligase RNF170 [Nilaparvata lugens]|uniref:E3 ubiquitin-protein ligase RNF170 n=1 Tax=Nilaparvata lugens TaxID=108931 RepID=UPI000B99327B|nr:E3 ubiquitin-protein ligase RNF170 [Nilaparvata lugens]
MFENITQSSEHLLNMAKDSLIYGIGDEVLLATVIAVISIGLWIFLYGRNDVAALWGFFARRQPVIDPANEPEAEDNANPNPTCPICLDACQMALETNCGHTYCGVCLKTLYEMNGYVILRCPTCRQMVSMLFLHLTQREENAPNNTALAVNRAIVIDFFNLYNVTHSGIERNIMEHLRDLPTLLRNLWYEFFTINGMLRFRFRVRIGFYCSMLLFYLCVPFDIIPESMFGLLGLMDDILISLVFLVYLAALYRRHVLDRH